MYALKQFRHYLLGRHFKLLTDHAPLQWLSAQKMEGMLCRWALALQEYDFDIVYRKGSANTNADSLSRCAITLSTPDYHLRELQEAQENDQVIGKVRHARLQSDEPPKSSEWHQQPLGRYRQLWSQLSIMNGVLYRRYTPGPAVDEVVYLLFQKR